MAPRDLARLPVVSRDDPGHLIGLISRSDILRAYDVAMVRKQRGQLLTDHAVLRREEKNDFMEVRLQPGDYAIGKPVKDLDLPREVNAVSVEREGELYIPKGDTVFAAGDVVTLFGRCEALVRARKALTGRDGRETC